MVAAPNSASSPPNSSAKFTYSPKFTNSTGWSRGATNRGYLWVYRASAAAPARPGAATSTA